MLCVCKFMYAASYNNAFRINTLDVMVSANCAMFTVNSAADSDTGKTGLEQIYWQLNYLHCAV